MTDGRMPRFLPLLVFVSVVVVGGLVLRLMYTSTTLAMDAGIAIAPAVVVTRVFVGLAGRFGWSPAAQSIWGIEVTALWRGHESKRLGIAVEIFWMVPALVWGLTLMDEWGAHHGFPAWMQYLGATGLIGLVVAAAITLTNQLLTLVSDRWDRSRNHDGGRPPSRLPSTHPPGSGPVPGPP